MLDNAAQGYSHPDYTATQNVTLNLSGNLEADTSNSYAANLYYRHLQRDILNSNVNTLVSASTNDGTCTASSSCPGSNLLAHAVQDIVGTNLQWSNTDPLWEHTQTFTLGLNLELSHTAFDNQGQDAYVDASRAMVATDAYMPQASIVARTTRWGLFATSTWDANDALSITASARYDYANLTLDGWSCVSNDLCDSSASLASGQLTDVSGSNSYQRLNPALGMTYLLAPQLIAFANYAEGLRTPSAIELACADPAVPCSGIPNAFGADPHLDAVVSRTYEIGLRGNLGSQLKWRTAYYQTRLENDILFNQSSLTTGYFSNVGATLRQGLEIGMDGHHRAWDYAVDLDWIQATYQSTFMVANPANSAPATPVQPGDYLPGIPAWVLKTRLSYALNTTDRVGLAVQAQGPSYARGDENNADVHGQVPGFTTVSVDLHHSLGKSLQLNAGVNNLLDQRYANYGVLATNLISTGAAEQFQSLGAPRSLYVGLQARF
jgi:outer membrane receptor protein involved in Fe transport